MATPTFRRMSAVTFLISASPSCESPFEGGSSLFIVGLKGQQSCFELGQGGEVVWGEYFSLNDREIDLDLIEPTGMDGCMDKVSIGPLGAQSRNRFLTAMGRAVVHDPKDAVGRTVGLLGHHFCHQTVHRRDTVFRLATAEDFGPMHVPSGEVRAGAFPEVFMFDAHCSAAGWR